MTIRIVGPLLCGGLLALAVLTPATAPAAPVIATCSPTKVTISASALDNSSRSALTYADIPETQVNFTQGGGLTGPSCVIVRFSALAAGGSLGALLIRALLDNTIAARPAEVAYSVADGTVGRAHSFEFVFPSVAPGPHNVRMQFKSGPGNHQVFVHRHNTVVQYHP